VFRISLPPPEMLADNHATGISARVADNHRIGCERDGCACGYVAVSRSRRGVQPPVLVVIARRPAPRLAVRRSQGHPIGKYPSSNDGDAANAMLTVRTPQLSPRPRLVEIIFALDPGRHPQRQPAFKSAS
jgi:hypothetical protein